MRNYLAAIAMVSAPFVTWSHPGGLNGEGCHNNRKTGDYHCHRAPAGQSANSKTQPQSGQAPTCYTGPRGGTYTITPSGKKNYSGC